MAGEEGGGALRVPPELASNEVVTRLLGDNQQLREALRRSNQALRVRCEEMEGWQRRTKEEREFISCRFQEARALVERLSQENRSLSQENRSLLVHANGPGTSIPGASSSTGGPSIPGSVSSPNLKPPGPSQSEENGLPDRNRALPSTLNPEERGRERKRTEESESQTTPPRSLPSQGANEFLQLLKSHKEKMEEGMKDLRRRNEELERGKEEAEKDKEVLRRTVDQLRAKLAQTQACGVTEDAVVQRSEASHSSDRHRELQEKLDCLQKSSAQRDRTEALLKQRDKDCAQLAKECEAIRCQATSLMGELRESRSCLEKSEQDRKHLEDKLCSKQDSLQGAERELEQLRKQHHVAVDKLLLQTQNLETALKAERHVVTEERKKLTQLQHAYTCLFKDYDSKLKAENQGGDLSSRLEEAERALALKQDLIDKLKEEVEQQRASLETVPVLTAQAEIYKADFLAEREAREKLHQRKEELQDLLTQAQNEIDKLKQEGTSRLQMEEMQQRHGGREDFMPRPLPPQQFPGAAFTVPAPSSYRNERLPVGGAGGGAGGEELPDYRCPKCQYQAPDMDTLQIHVMDCIQ